MLNHNVLIKFVLGDSNVAYSYNATELNSPIEQRLENGCNILDFISKSQYRTT